ncbi:MAG: FCD domain-containing protein [Limimaricola sp.]|nr:FCD domain-containing protein [Limimaricola sp.]
MPDTKKQRCLNDLRRRILMLDIAPGSDLDEVTLSKDYGLSRTPLREVLQRLAGEGFLVLEVNRGAKVASMDIDTMRTFFQTAPLIYASIGQLAAQNRTTRQLDALKDVQTAFAVAAREGDAERAAMLNHSFHRQIGEMARNPYLMASLGRLLIDHTRLSQTFYRPGSPIDSLRVAMAVDQHEAMISALESCEPSLMTELTLRHWDLSRDRMEDYVRPDPLPVDVVAFKAKRNAF